MVHARESAPAPLQAAHEAAFSRPVNLNGIKSKKNHHFGPARAVVPPPHLPAI